MREQSAYFDETSLDANDLANQAAEAADKVIWLRHNPNTGQRILSTLAITEGIGWTWQEAMHANPYMFLERHPGSTYAYLLGAIAVDFLVARPLSKSLQRRRYENAKPQDVSPLVPVGSLEIHKVLQKSKNMKPELHAVWSAPELEDDTPPIKLADIAGILASTADKLGVDRVAIQRDIHRLEIHEAPKGAVVVPRNTYFKKYLNYTGPKHKKYTVDETERSTTAPEKKRRKSKTGDLLIVTPAALHEFAMTDELEALQRSVDWITSRAPEHPLAAVVAQHENFADAVPFIKRKLLGMTERKLFSSEIRLVEEPDEPSSSSLKQEATIHPAEHQDHQKGPNKIRERVERSGKIFYNDGLRVQWYYSDGKVDGIETLHSALEISEHEQQDILKNPDAVHHNKAIRAHELRALELAYAHEHNVEESQKRLSDTEGYMHRRGGLLERTVGNRIGTVRNSRTQYNSDKVLEHRPFRRLYLCAGALALGAGFMAVQGVADEGWRDIVDRIEAEHPEYDQVQVFNAADAEYAANPLWFSINKMIEIDEDINYVTFKQIASVWEKLGKDIPDDVSDEISNFENQNELDQRLGPSKTLNSLSSQIGNVGDLGKNVPLVEVKGHGMETGGYWALSRFEALILKTSWENDRTIDEISIDLIHELPSALPDDSVPHIEARTNKVSVLDDKMDYLTRTFPDYKIMSLPVRTGTHITALKVEGAQDTGDRRVNMTYIDPASGEQYVFIPFSQIEDGEMITYWLTENSDLPIRATQPISFPDMYDVKSTSDATAEAYTQKDAIEEAQGIWEKYVPEIKDIPMDQRTQFMLSHIQGETYSLNPLKKGDINTSPLDVIGATLRNGEAVCNTANSTLALSSPDYLMPVGGYLNGDGSDSGDGSGYEVISTNEAHLWTVDRSGSILDATPRSGGEDIQGFKEGDTSLDYPESHLPQFPTRELAAGGAAVVLAMNQKRFRKLAARANAIRLRRRAASFPNERIVAAYDAANRAQFAPVGLAADPLFPADQQTFPARDVMTAYLAGSNAASAPLTIRQKIMIRTLRANARRQL